MAWPDRGGMVLSAVSIVLATINCIWDFTDEDADIWRKVAGLAFAVLCCNLFVQNWRSYRRWKKANEETDGADSPET